MDYVVGGVAALISGNVTPNRPKSMKRALTPVKHQPSPNVTPKSELAGDRSIFLSPSVQKKKAIVKKSPKRIFQNPDLDVTQNSENDPDLISPKAEKVKKNIKTELGIEEDHETSASKLNKKKKTNIEVSHNHSPIKKKLKNSKLEVNCDSEESQALPHATDIREVSSTSPKKKKKKIKTEVENVDSFEHTEKTLEKYSTPKKKIKKNKTEAVDNDNSSESTKKTSSKKSIKSKKRKAVLEHTCNQSESDKDSNITSIKLKKKKSGSFVNPNAITNKDTDSEHESDNEIQSENDDVNKEVFKSEMPDESSDDECPPQKQQEKPDNPEEKWTQDEINRTLFVGNVHFNKKCKKEVKSIFSKYGQIKSVRIRTVPVKDARITPKLAVIKNELHPERTTVNVYVKFEHASSVEKALVENNTVLNNCHLRVSRSNTTGAEHDPRCAVFVGNVPFALEDEALWERFQGCGEIASVRIVRDKKTSAGKGFGYVNFATKDSVELALAMSEEDLTIKNKILRVKRCIGAPQQQRQQPGKSPRGSYRGRGQGRGHGNRGFNHRGSNQERTLGSTSQQQFQSSRNPRGGFRGRGQGPNRFGNRGFNQRGPNQESTAGGAQRRIMNKRKVQNTDDGPPEKIHKQFNGPHKEKKARQEFVGMTAGKKKKQNTFDKGQKKKRALSEILAKHK